MIPFELKATIKDYIWGGTKLREIFGKESELERLAESWELSCHPDGESIIASGEYAGMTLTQFLREHPEAMGTSCSNVDEFPVLVKLIDAKNDLSIQVHPEDSYARVHENDNGKTEMWYIIDAEEGAELVYGFKAELTKDEFKIAIENNTLMDKLNRVPVKKGDVFFINPGTLHAIGKGILIAEIQQSSNVTYRVYDYGRLGADGKPRQLHVEKALEVTKLGPAEEYKLPAPDTAGEELTVQQLADCKFFRVFRFDMTDENGELWFNEACPSFQHILVLDGSCQLVCGGNMLPLKKGSSVFVPAGADAFNITGKCSMIITTV